MVRQHLEPKQLVDVVALLGIEDAELLRNRTCVGLEKSSRIVLKVLETVAAVFERREFASGSLTGHAINPGAAPARRRHSVQLFVGILRLAA